jgi:hypothetical protein
MEVRPFGHAPLLEYRISADRLFAKSVDKLAAQGLA